MAIDVFYCEWGSVHTRPPGRSTENSVILSTRTALAAVRQSRTHASEAYYI